MKRIKNGKIRIGLDIDGTIRNIYPRLLQALETRYPGIIFPPISRWNKYEIWKILRITEEKLKKIWFDSAAYDIYRLSPPYEKVGLLTSAMPTEYEIILLSDQPNKRTAIYTEEWVDYHLPRAAESHLRCRDKNLVLCDYYIEDSPYQLQKLFYHDDEPIYNFPGVLKINRPWNKQCHACHESFDTLKEALEYIQNES